ncbi:MAG: PIG-L family deacetylase [Geobacteraceae bacterium]|nr:PIG-L family deacetylase [Geobacteraceae bacterium]
MFLLIWNFSDWKELNLILSKKLKYAGLIVLLLLVAGIVGHYFAMGYLYDFDVAADYRYNFINNKNVMNSLPVKVDKDHFILPKISDDWDTGLLRVDIKSSFFGKVFAPYIEVSCQGKQYNQYFEYGAKGTRYINISHLSHAASSRIALKGHHLSWDVQDSQFFLFKNPKIADKKILVIAPHPDDAEIAAFGLYSYKNSYVLTVTDGSTGAAKYEKYFYGTDKESSYGMVAKLRVIDSLTVPVMGGVAQQNCYNLAYFAETLKTMNSAPVVDVKNKYSGQLDNMPLRKLNIPSLPHDSRPNWQSLVSDLVYVLNVIKPDIIVTPHPLLDSNLDHQFSTHAVFEAMKKAKLSSDGKLYLYSNHYILGRSCQSGPQGSMTSLPPLFSDIKFSSIYSYEIPQNVLTEKTFALDAMHDLRPLPYRINISTAAFISNTFHALVDYLRNGTEFDLSYYRKALKANELFYVYPFMDAAEIGSAKMQSDRLQ